MTRFGVVYALGNPSTGEIRYIGQSTKPSDRLKQHAKMKPSVARRMPYLARWLRTLDSQPAMWVLEVCSSRDELDQAECDWIAAGRIDGLRLCNIADGGHKQLAGCRRGPREAFVEGGRKGGRALAGIPKSPEHAAKCRANLQPRVGPRPEAERLAISRGRGIRATKCSCKILKSGRVFRLCGFCRWAGERT